MVSLGRNNSPGPAISQSELTEPMRTVFVSAPIDKLSVLLDNDQYVDDYLGNLGDLGNLGITPHRESSNPGKSLL